MNEAVMIECPTCTSPVQSDLLIPAGTTQVCVNCRDEYMQRMKEGISTSQTGEWVAIREAHIKHEASLRSVGILYYIGAFFMLVGGVVGLFTTVASSSGAGDVPFMVGFLAFYIVLGVISILVGRGFRNLKRWVRIPGTILAALGLLSIPIGTLINGYILYLMFSAKGKMVFSPEYQEIRDATPEVKYKTSVISWIILIMLVVGILGLIGYLWAVPAGG
ncbi:MAG: hypothetical protein ACSHX8_05635 [Opitutaceae bacterium]